jgi:hypothetical protein
VFQRILVLGMLGVLGLIGGCSSWPSSTLDTTRVTGTAEKRSQASTGLASAVKAEKTKQVTIAVRGMT